MDEGSLKLSRKFFSNELWNAARKFSECEAWLDLIQSACWSTGEARNGRLIGGREVSYERGQYPASVSFLRKKWGWETDKRVRCFLDKLKKKGMITTDSSQGINIITLVKYDEYNPPPSKKGQAEGQGKGQAEGKESLLTYRDLEEFGARLGASIRADVGAMLREFAENMTPNVSEEGQAKGNNKKNIYNNIIQETPTNVGAKKDTPPAPTPYENLQKWMEENTPHVLKMDSPITEKQYQKLKEKYRHDQLVEILQAMENYKDLCKKYTSAYLTFLKWAKKEYGN